MGVTVKERDDDPGAWWLYVNHQGRRKAKRVGVGPKAKKAAELAAVLIRARLAQGDSSMLEEPKAAVPHPELPRLRDALPEWISRQERSSEIRPSTAKAYKCRLATWVYPLALPDGRRLGDLPVNQVTREMIGAVIWRVKEAGRSLAIIEAIRNPLRGYFASLIETKVLPGPNPAGDLRYFIGKGARTKARHPKYFSQDEGPRLIEAAQALYPRWAVFIMTGLLAGLRWGESGALVRSDIDWSRGRLHVQRTISGRGAVAPPKNGRDRWVKASPALLKALRSHLEAIDLDGSIEDWSPEQRQLVFPTSGGNTVRYPYFHERVWKPLLNRAKLPYRKYHATRHSYATWLLDASADIRWVQAQLGHASISQTVDTYGHIQVERHEHVVEVLDRQLKRA